MLAWHVGKHSITHHQDNLTAAPPFVLTVRTRAGSLYDLTTLRVAYGVSLYGEALDLTVYACPCAGSLYDLLTLRVAYGVSLYGEATEEYTWFPGYAWTLAYCRGCSAHLVRARCCAVVLGVAWVLVAALDS